MSTTVTHDVKVTVRTRYESAHSDPIASRYLFSYRITITNSGRDAVQLQRRHWWIRDGLSALREVEGPGVVGETPVIQPGKSYSYSSACDLKSAFGRMDGTYAMVRVQDGLAFEVVIPEIQLHWPHSAN